MIQQELACRALAPFQVCQGFAKECKSQMRSVGKSRQTSFFSVYMPSRDYND
ncbi:MAG TPA: hypothetical protein V6C85_21005 [Allocoleopsis sp.]